MKPGRAYILIGGDACVTQDRISARTSVETLAALHPAIAATGHGTPMGGEALTEGLAELLARFDEGPIPDCGKYVP